MERDQGNIQNNIVQTQLRHSGAGKQNPRDSENARDSGQEILGKRFWAIDSAIIQIEGGAETSQPLRQSKHQILDR
jgi:hypothetical protein